MGESKRRQRLNPDYGKSKYRKIKIGEIAKKVHERYGRGFFTTSKGDPLIFWKGTPHLSEIDSDIVNSIDINSQYVVIDFPYGHKNGYSELATFNISDETQPKVEVLIDATIQEIVDGLRAYEGSVSYPEDEESQAQDLSTKVEKEPKTYSETTGDSTNKTLKQLLTEPFRVQQKQGYYSYELFRSSVLKLFLLIADGTGVDLLNILAVDIIHRFYDRILSLMESNENELQEKTLRGSLFLLMYLVENHKKIFFLDKGLCELLLETRLPASCNVSRLFCESCLVLLPKNLDLGVGFFLIASAGERGFVVSCFPPKSSVPISLEFGYGQSFDSSEFESDENVSIPAWKITKLLVNFLLWQQSMYDKGEEAIILNAPTRQMSFGKNSKQIIVPQVIGEGYKPKVIRNYESQGTHASPRTHWRSGHWRQQPYGSKEEPKYKTLWIEPILVNG